MILERKVFVKRNLDTVYRYLLNFSNIFEWDSHVVQAERVDLGPIKEGSKFELEYRLFGFTQTLIYELIELNEGKKLVFKTEAKNFSTIDTISLSEESKGTEITYQAEVNLSNKFSELLFKPKMALIANDTVKNLKRALEREEKPLSYKKAKVSLLNIFQKCTSMGWNKQKNFFPATLDQKKTVLITGATSGLGLSCAQTLAGKDCDLILVGRNDDKLKKVKSELTKKGYSGSLSYYLCDMENLEEVNETCQKILEDKPSLDAIINNAGALYNEEKIINEIERSTLVNLVAPYLFSKILSPLLKEKKGCIINVSSGGMYSTPLSIESLKKSPSPYSGAKAYAYAKRGQVVFSEFLNHEFKQDNVKVHSMHPGWANTPGVSSSLPGFFKLLKKLLRTPFEGADTLVWLVMRNPEKGGFFWLDRKPQRLHLLNSTKQSKDTPEDLIRFLEKFRKND